MRPVNMFPLCDDVVFVACAARINPFSSIVVWSLGTATNMCTSTKISWSDDIEMQKRCGSCLSLFSSSFDCVASSFVRLLEMGRNEISMNCRFISSVHYSNEKRIQMCVYAFCVLKSTSSLKCVCFVKEHDERGGNEKTQSTHNILEKRKFSIEN